MKRKRILHIVENYPPFERGGAELSASQIISSTSTVFEHIVVSNWQSTVKDSVQRCLIRTDTLLKRILFPIALIINFVRLSRIIKKNKPHIIHLTNYFGVYESLLSSIIFSIPLVVDVRDYWLISPDRIIYPQDIPFSFMKYVMQKRQYESRSLFKIPYRLITSFLFIIRRILFKYIQYFVCLSNTQKEILKKNGYKHKRIYVIPNFVDKRLRTNNKKSNIHTFLYSGRLEKIKGIWPLVYAFGRLRRDNINLTMVGDGKVYQRVKRYIENNNITNISLKKFIPYHKMTDYYRDCHAIIAPSMWEEPFGRYIIDSIKYSKPLICSPTRTCKEFLTHRKNCLMIKPIPNAIAGAVEEYVNNKSLYLNIQRNISAYSRLNKVIIIKKWISTYQAVASKT